MAASRFCWGAHDPPTVKALRTLATHIVGTLNATALPLRNWGSFVLYRLEGRTGSKLGDRQAALQRFLAALRAAATATECTSIWARVGAGGASRRTRRRPPRGGAAAGRRGAAAALRTSSR